MPSYTRSTHKIHGTYACANCGKLTCESGYHESEERLCAYCFRAGKLMDGYNHSELSMERFRNLLAMLKAEYGRP